MSPISIPFATATNPGFQWLDSFESLGDKEIEDVIILLRGVIAVCFAVLTDRRKPWSDTKLEDSYDMLQATAELINNDETHELDLDNVHQYLAGPSDAQKERSEIKAARQYLRLVSIAVGWPYALLILCALGKWRLQNLDDDQRVNILRYVFEKRGSLFCSRLEDKAVQCDLHQIHVKVEPPLTRGSKKRPRKRDDSEDAATDRKVPGRNNPNSRRLLPSNGKLPSATVTAQKIPISGANAPIPQNTLCKISSRPSLNEPALTLEYREPDGQPTTLTFDSEENFSSLRAELGQTEAFRTSDLVPNAGHRGFSTPVDNHIIDALTLEATFNRNSIPICQRPYGSPIFMRVLEGDIHGVYNILLRCEGSLWDHDPYGLGILYYAAHYCWKGSGMEQAMAMYYALVELGAQDDEFACRTDEIGNRPVETINDWLLASRARGQIAGACDQVYKEHEFSRGFTKLHKVLLQIDSGCDSVGDYLISLRPEEVAAIIDVPDALGRTPLAWAVEYGLTASTELLLKLGANPNQLRLTKDGGFSPLIHIAIAGPRSAWMDDEIVETVRLLLAAGADINGTDHEGWTALHIAASWSLFRVTDMLHQCGREFLAWDAQTLQGETIFDTCDNTDYLIRYWGMLNSPMPLI